MERFDTNESFSDQTSWLTACGVLELLIGAGCLLLIPMMRLAGKTAGADAMMMAMVMYAALGAGFITMGFGTMTGRRWARSLMEAACFLWVMWGSFGMVYLVFLMPSMLRKVPGGVGAIVGIVAVGASAVLYIGLPLLLYTFYRRPDVKATFRAKDPNVPWTDRVPTPILTLVLALVLYAGSGLMGIRYAAVPFFGIVLQGPAGYAVKLGQAAVFGWAAWACWRLDLRAWWAALITVVLFGVSGMITFLTTDMTTWYHLTGMTDQQIELISSQGMLSGPRLALMCGVGAAVTGGYILYVRRFFTMRATDATNS